MKKNLTGVNAIKMGISQLAALVLVALSADKNGDGEIDNTEKVQLVGGILPQLFPVFNLYGEIREELDDKVTDEEFNELVEHTQNLNFLPPGKEAAERFVKDIFLWINYNRRFTLKAIDFFQNRKNPVVES